MLMLTKKVQIYNETIINIIRIFISQEKVTCDDRDPVSIKKTINEKICLTSAL